MLLGVRADLLADPRRLHDRRRLQGGYTPNPTYEETTHRPTGHTEAVRVVYDPAKVDLEALLKAFWENHDPTTPNQQGNDVGTQYRSAIYPTTDAQLAAVEESRSRYQQALKEAGFGEISTEIRPAAEAGTFWYAEDYHQGYLHKNPRGYCNHGFCQVGYDAAAHGQDAPTKVEPPRGLSHSRVLCGPTHQPRRARYGSAQGS